MAGHEVTEQQGKNSESPPNKSSFMTDEQLLTEYAQTGNQAAFSELYRRMYLPICSLIYRMVHDAELARDVAQDTFLIVLRKAGQFRSDCKAFTWICAIAQNRLMTVKRRRVPAQAPECFSWLGHIDHRPGPAAEAADQQERDNLNRILETEMGDTDAEIIRLLDIDGITYEDAAEHLDIPIGTVRSRRHRAVNRLRNLMAAVVLLAVGVGSSLGAIWGAM